MAQVKASAKTRGIVYPDQWKVEVVRLPATTGTDSAWAATVTVLQALFNRLIGWAVAGVAANP